RAGAGGRGCRSRPGSPAGAAAPPAPRGRFARWVAGETEPSAARSRPRGRSPRPTRAGAARTPPRGPPRASLAAPACAPRRPREEPGSKPAPGSAAGDWPPEWKRGGKGGFLDGDPPARLGLDLGRAGGARERVEVFAGGGADPRPVRALAGHLEGGVQGLLAQPAARVRRDERSIGLDRVVFVAGRGEAPRHRPVHVTDGEQRVVAVPALRIAGDHAAE